MEVTFRKPGTLTVNFGHVTASGKTMVTVDERDGEPSALIVYLTPEVAAQWVEALTPLAGQVKP